MVKQGKICLSLSLLELKCKTLFERPKGVISVSWPPQATQKKKKTSERAIGENCKMASRC